MTPTPTPTPTPSDALKERYAIAADAVCEARNTWHEHHEENWLETDENHPDDYIARAVVDALDRRTPPASSTTPTNPNDIGSKSVDGQSVEQRARELLDSALRELGLHEDAYRIGCGSDDLDPFERASIGAIATALRSIDGLLANAVALHSVEPVRNAYTFEQPSARVLPDVNALAQFIRVADGSNRMGAGELAEHIIDWMQLRCANMQQPRAPEPVALSRHSRAMLLNVLWHHQGGSSSVGQPLRSLLGIGQHDPLDAEQVNEAKRIDGLLANAVAPPAPREFDVWRCSHCGELLDAIDSAWRLTGEIWQHHHDGSGHIDAVNFGSPAVPRESDQFTAALAAAREHAPTGQGGESNDYIRGWRDVLEYIAMRYSGDLPATAPREAAQEPIGRLVITKGGLFGMFANSEFYAAQQRGELPEGAYSLYTHPAPQQRESAPFDLQQFRGAVAAHHLACRKKLRNLAEGKHPESYRPILEAELAEANRLLDLIDAPAAPLLPVTEGKP